MNNCQHFICSCIISKDSSNRLGKILVDNHTLEYLVCLIEVQTSFHQKKCFFIPVPNSQNVDDRSWRENKQKYYLHSPQAIGVLNSDSSPCGTFIIAAERLCCFFHGFIMRPESLTIINVLQILVGGWCSSEVWWWLIDRIYFEFNLRFAFGTGCPKNGVLRLGHNFNLIFYSLSARYAIHLTLLN